MTANFAAVEQTLHGYEAGHRLLSSSVDLPPDARDVLAALSDLSGTRLQPGFESYLSGYPLGGTEYYVFARTWLAPEMPRPGCVWTHSLLIPVADLAFLKRLPRLTRQHVRPMVGRTHDYAKSIEVPLHGIEHSSLTELEGRLARSMTRALYGAQSDRPLVVAANSSEEFEQLVLRIWDQQWPRLRRTFTFCTGALSKRVLNGCEFDLQVMPFSAARKAGHGRALVVGPGAVAANEPIDVVIEVDSTPGERLGFEDDDSWNDAVVSDLMSGDPESALRQWMVLIGAERGEARSSARASLRLAALLAESPPRTQEVVRVLAEAYPDAEAGLRIKRAILGGADSPEERRALPEAEVLTTLATTPHVEAFMALGDAIRGRALHLWLNDPARAAAVLYGLANKSLNGLGAEVLRGLAEAIPSGEFAAVTRARPGLLALAAESRPSLLEDRKIWEVPQLRREAIQVLSLIPASNRPPAEVVLRALVESGTSDFSPLGLLYAPKTLTTALVSLIRGGEYRSQFRSLMAVDASLRCVLTRGLPEVFSDIVDDARMLALLVESTDVETLRCISVEAWSEVVSRYGFNIEPVLAGGILAAVMLSDGREAGVVASRVFPIVYEAAGTDHLPDRAWQQVASGLPGVAPWLEWDRCERLRRWLIDAFVSKGPWKFQDFVSAIPDDAALDGLLGYGMSHSRSRDFLRRLAEAIEEGRVKVNGRPREAILEAGRVRKWRLF